VVVTAMIITHAMRRTPCPESHGKRMGPPQLKCEPYLRVDSADYWLVGIVSDA